MVYHYHPDPSYLRTAFTYRDTVLPSVLADKEFWIFLVLHLMCMVTVLLGWIQKNDETEMQEHGIHIITTFTTFFEVFYANNCYHRYKRRYDLTRHLLSLMYDVSFEQIVYFKAKARTHMRVSCRWLIASIMLFFWDISNQGSKQKLPVELLEQGLMKQIEMDDLEQIPPMQRCSVLLAWSAQLAKEAMFVVGEKVTQYKTLIAQYERCRELQQNIMDDLSMPMPFHYFHLLNVLVVINLSLWAWSMAMVGSLWSPIFFFFAAMILMGMAEVSKALAEPYGEDDVDFSLEEWIGEFVENVVAVMEDDWLGCDNEFFATVDRERPMRQGRRRIYLSIPTQEREAPSWGGNNGKGYVQLLQTLSFENTELAEQMSQESARMNSKEQVRVQYEALLKHSQEAALVDSARRDSPDSNLDSYQMPFPPPLVPILILPFSESRLGVDMNALASAQTGSVFDVMALSGKPLLSIAIQDTAGSEANELVVALAQRRQDRKCTILTPPRTDPGAPFRIFDSDGAFYGLFAAISPGINHVTIQGRDHLRVQGEPAELKYSVSDFTGKPLALCRVNPEDYPGGDHLEMRVLPGQDIVLICAIVLAISIFSTYEQTQDDD